jgi:hypothetical protein
VGRETEEGAVAPASRVPIATATGRP